MGPGWVLPTSHTGGWPARDAMDSLICAIPRSGSNRLCSFLMNTKEAGEPRKYLCPHQIAEHGPKTSSGPRTIEGHRSRYLRSYDGARVAEDATRVHREQRDGASQQWRDRDREIVRERAVERALQPS